MQWGCNTAKTGFKDRLERNAVRMANGKTAIDTRFFDTGDGTAIGSSIQDAQTEIVVPSFDTSGDFTWHALLAQFSGNLRRDVGRYRPVLLLLGDQRMAG